VIPVVQDFAFLNLEPIQIGIPLKDALSAENIRVEVPSVFTVAIGNSSRFEQASSNMSGLNEKTSLARVVDFVLAQE
jgi:flotillin